MKKLTSYWPAYKECPDCGKKQKNNESYFSCKGSNCDYTEQKFIFNQKRETRVKKVVEEMVDYLLTNDSEYKEPVPSVRFPSEAFVDFDRNGRIIKGGCYICQPGWYAGNWFSRTINIPTKVLYLPNKEIIEVTSHESAHASTQLGHESQKWHHKYMDYRKQAFSQFSSFANESNKEARYTLNYSKEFYKKNYGYDLEDLKYDPNEDD